MSGPQTSMTVQNPISNCSWAGWFSPVMPALESRGRRSTHEFWVGPIYLVSSRPSRTIEWGPVSKAKQNTPQNKIQLPGGRWAWPDEVTHSLTWAPVRGLSPPHPHCLPVYQNQHQIVSPWVIWERGPLSSSPKELNHLQQVLSVTQWELSHLQQVLWWPNESSIIFSGLSLWHRGPCSFLPSCEMVLEKEINLRGEETKFNEMHSF